MKIRAGFLIVALLASCALLVHPTQAQVPPAPVQCALTSVNVTCAIRLLNSYSPGQVYACTTDSSGTWSGQLDFAVQGLETPAAASGFQPNTNMGGVTNTTGNGLWTFSVANAAQFLVYVDTPGSFTGTANVGIRCSPSTFQQSNSAQVSRNVTVVAPTDGSGNVKVNCQTGCSASATIPPEVSTSSPLPVSTSLPVIGQMYFWNGTGWIAVSATSPLPVTTAAAGGGGSVPTMPAPTPSGTIPPSIVPVYGMTAFWNGTVYIPVSASTPLPVTTINPSLPAPQVTWPVTTPAPLATIPGETSTTAPLAVVTSLPVIGQHYWWNGTGWIADTLSSPAPEQICSEAGNSNCALVNTNNELSIVCASAQYPCGIPTPIPFATSAAGAPANTIANAVCSSGTACVPAATNLNVTCAVTTTKTQCIAAPGAGSIHITALQALGEESATGGIMDIFTGTGTNCATTATTIPILAMGAAFTANQQVTWGNGYGTIIPVAATTEVCVGATAGTITTASITFDYAVY